MSASVERSLFSRGESFEHGYDRGDIGRLDQMSNEPRLHRHAPRALVTVTGERDESGGVVLDADLACHFIAVHPGQTNVEEYDLRPPFEVHFERGPAIVRYPNLVAHLLEKIGEGFGRVDVVIDHEDPPCRAADSRRIFGARDRQGDSIFAVSRQADDELAP